MIELSMSDLSIFFKYCANRIGQDDFHIFMAPIYVGPRSYIDNLWPSFRSNPIEFIIGRGERELFELIRAKINHLGYKG